MNNYKISLFFSGASESVSVNIAATSAEDAIASIRPGNGTVLHIGTNGPDKNEQNSVSCVYIETIRVSKVRLEEIYRCLFARKKGEQTLAETVLFPDGAEMHITCCGEENASGWTEALLFCGKKNFCTSSADIRDKFEGVWKIQYNDVPYIVIVIPEVNMWDKNLPIITLPGSCLDSTAQVVAHQTNCKGVMGAGVALAIRKKYPEIMPEYQSACQSRHMLGQCQLIATEDERYIANLFGQDGFGRGRQTNYAALQSSFDSLVNLMQSHGLTSLSMPYNLGCGLAGGDWDVVFEMIKKTFTGKNLRVELWKLD